MAENKDCIFCKIVEGKIPCYKVYETDKVLAFLDINPYCKGHLLVIPKNHSRWLWDMEEKGYLDLMKESKYLANVLRKAMDTEWIEEVVAGVGAEHTHVHLLPRKKNDGIGEIPTKPLIPKPSEQEMKDLAERIKSCL